MLGVLAFGDSITNGGGELQWGVALQSWALWLARAYGLPYSGYAVDGALASDVVASQIPAFSARGRDGRFDVGCLYIGANDVRSFDWDVPAYARDVGSAVSFLRERCERVVVCTLPLDLGRPRAGAVKVGQANAVLRSLDGVVVCELDDFGARNRVMTDHVHPTAFGQISIAERAIRALGDEPAVWPSQLVAWEETRWRRLRGDATYTYRAAKAALREVRHQAVAMWLRSR